VKKDTDDKTRSEETPSTPSAKRPYVKPQVTFVPPQLTKHGGLTKVTGQGFFGGFSPGIDEEL
jgi:hypothetical protein